MPNEMTGMALTSRITENEKRTLEDTVRKFTNVKKAEEFTDRLWNLLIGDNIFNCLINFSL